MRPDIDKQKVQAKEVYFCRFVFFSCAFDETSNIFLYMKNKPTILNLSYLI